MTGICGNMVRVQCKTFLLHSSNGTKISHGRIGSSYEHLASVPLPVSMDYN